MSINDIKYYFSDFASSDIEELMLFWEATGVGGKHRGDNSEIILNSVENGGRLILMKLDTTNEIIGSAWVTTDKRRTYLHYFAISKEYRGKGFANELMDVVMDHAQLLGLQFRLEVHEDNIPALELYKKYGFDYLGDYNIYINRNLQKK
ncbi:MAG: GNAT family N-acetyltransferase [Candidatus Delongbacteria bacterium]|jgi:ribosomal protein S18 acetylase RimI-like enzyme|nr:GNAT family N-acetyltransferase [Candidatus Delongbacteria bacterium]